MSETVKEKITSATEYNKYLKVIKPSTWIIILALIILIGIGVFWAFTGNILTTQTCKSVLNGDTAIGYVTFENSNNVKVGQNVNITLGDAIVGGVLESVGSLPVGIDEAANTLGSKVLAENILPENGGVEVTARLSKPAKANENSIVSMEIVTQDIAPIELLMGEK